MLKRGLFIKIYLSFWLIIALVILNRFAFDYFDASSQVNWKKHHIVSSLGLYGKAQIAYYQTGNSQAVTQLAEQFKQTDGIDAYLLDSTLQRLNGSLESPSIVNLAERALKNGKNDQLRENGMAIIAVPISAPDGKQFIVIGTYSDNGFMSPAPALVDPNRLLRISIIVFISGLICFLLAKYLVAPLVILREATTRFAAGEHSVRVGFRFGTRRDEITELAKDFDKMAEQIESLMKLQRQLIGDISHELRSPLARLNVALDLARQHTGSDAEHALNRIEEEAQELNDMIGELLTLTRLGSDNMPVVMEKIDLVGLVREIVADGDFEAQGSNRGVKLVESDACIINGNNDLLRRAIENVVRNAIHYTFENTEVEVSVKRKKQDNVEIIIRDHGSGVPEGELINIYQPFYRTSESRERQTGGTGLGLAISERAIKLHNGTIRAENADGGGLMVHLFIPLCHTHSKRNVTGIESAS